MATAQQVQTPPDAPAPAGTEPEVYRYYELAKKQEWQMRDMPWQDLPPIPETTGAPKRVEKRRGIWRSVITQQLQADSLAVEMAAQLLEGARHHDAKLYYSTMAQDEARHVEAWLRLVAEAGGPTERDPHLDKLATIFLGLDELEVKVFLMQVFFERMIIPRFRLIARSAPGTILADLCKRLTIDDGIHHSSGMAYERVLLRTASKKTKDQMIEEASRMLPIFAEHVLWRPKERAFITSAMRTHDVARLRAEIEDGIKIASSLGLDVGDIEYTIPRG
ncbi:MAG TPA: ferritin-like domain-containing protein [Gaiellaceae bacterium]|nr:ferritin-like domain-containing protein [Gaiellaceae bacterium]